jgi:hypothetical protein
MPYLCPHFAERYPQEKLMIYDETHELIARHQRIQNERILSVDDSLLTSFECFSVKLRWKDYLCPHFAERYPQEKLMIYDETHELLGIIDRGDIHLMEHT